MWCMQNFASNTVGLNSKFSIQDCKCAEFDECITACVHPQAAFPDTSHSAGAGNLLPRFAVP
jgi:hypothetical protein